MFLFFSYGIAASFLLGIAILEHMTKSAVIFSDEDQEKKEERNFHSPKRKSVNLSRDEYRQLIKDAYQEGIDDARNEQKHAYSDALPPLDNKKLSKKPKKRFSEQMEKERQRFEKNSIPENTKDSLEIEGKEDAMRKYAKEEQENLQRLKTITQRHEIEILRAKSVWPFTLFPDTLVIDTTKVTIVRKQLFATEYVATVPLKDLSDVNIQTVLFLGTLLIKYMPQSNTPGMNEPVNIRIPNLSRGDAIKAKNILKGALVAKAEEIDIAKLPPEEVVKVLEKFGGNEGIV